MRLRPDVQEEQSLLRAASPMLNQSVSIAMFALDTRQTSRPLRRILDALYLPVPSLDISFLARSAHRRYCEA